MVECNEQKRKKVLVIEMNRGHIESIRGSVIQAVFAEELPNINNKLVTGPDHEIILEVSSYIDDETVQAIALTHTAGLARGDQIIDAQAPIDVPVGVETLGKMFNVFGHPLTGDQDLSHLARKSIHQKPLAFSKRSTSNEIFETGIKAIDVHSNFNFLFNYQNNSIRK